VVYRVANKPSEESASNRLLIEIVLEIKSELDELLKDEGKAELVTEAMTL
jgi:hypothetical protein